MSANAGRNPPIHDGAERSGLIVRRVMEEEGLSPDDIPPNSSHIVNIHGKGKFYCIRCGRGWQSAFSWAQFHLRRALVSKWWKMKCSRCLSEQKPWFDPEQLEKMIRKAIRIYKRDFAGPPSLNQGVRRTGAPHLSKLCEKCGWGTTQCWRRENF